jgi:hypothetical protein
MQMTLCAATLFDPDQILTETIGATYSAIKNRDYPAALMVIAFARLMRDLNLRASPEADFAIRHRPRLSAGSK